MKPAPFEYHWAHSIDEAVELLGRGGEDAKLLAGGQSLVPMMNLRLARPSMVIDINGLPNLSFISKEDGVLRIGALTRHCQLENYPDSLEEFDALPTAARLIGHHPIRTRGTFGGSIAHADPVAEWCILTVLFDAQFLASGPNGQRAIPASDFFRGMFATDLQDDEILTETRLQRGYAHVALNEFTRRQGDFAVVAAAVGYDVEGGVINRPRVVLGGVANRPVAVPQVANLLVAEQPSHGLFVEAGRAAAAAVDPPADLHGSSEYRRHLAAVLTERALIEASAR